MILCVVASIAIAILSVVLNRDLGGAAALVGSLLGPSFVGKAAQSFSESKQEKSDEVTKEG